jgi:putative membrane-bound dehydrogenase-like protein
VPLPAEIQPESSAGSEAIADFRVPEGTTVVLVAAEPKLANPVAIEVDAQGRIYVAETFRQETEGVPDNRTFPEWLSDDLKLQTVEQRAEMMLEHHPEFATEWTDHDDRIRILTDEDGDGVAETSRVYAHGFHDLLDGTGAGLLARGNDVYYTCIPKLWKLSDMDDDGIADEGTALHHGFGVRVAFRGHDMHGLVLGPMRKLYFSIGDRGYHVVNHEGEVLSGPGRGAVFRCNLDGSELEVFAHGLRNPQELAFDDLGNLFTVDNNCDAGDRARLVHVLEGGDSGWSMNFQYLPDRGPWMSESWWKPPAEVDAHPAFLNAPIANITSGPSGLAAYPGVGLGPGMEGSFFVCDFLGGSGYSGIRRFTMKPEGASFRLDAEEEYWWGVLATDVCFEPDGSMLISDWVRGWIGEGFGRLYRARDDSADKELMRRTAALLGTGFQGLTSEELIGLMSYPDRRVRFEAQWELADRKQESSLFSLAVDPSASRTARVHALWGLAMLPADAQRAQEIVPIALGDDPSLQVQALRLLRAWRTAIGSERLLALLRSDSMAVRHATVMLVGSQGGDGGVLFPALEGEGSRDRALVQAVGWALAKSDLDNLSWTAEWEEDPTARLATVLAYRHRADGEALERFLEDADSHVAAEAANAIYDLDLTASFPALAATLDDGKEASIPMVRRAAAANNRIGGAEHAARLFAFVHSPASDPTLRKEVESYIRDWDRPAEFEPVRNEARPVFEGRASDWFYDKELPFLTAKDLDAVGRGREVFTGHVLAACTRCHSIRGITPAGRSNPAGPDLSSIGLALDEEELRASILDPGSSIARGFEILDGEGEVLPVSTMPPNLGDLLSEAELEDLIAFLAAQQQERRILVHVDSQGYEHPVAKAGEDGLSLVERSWKSWAEEDARFSVTIDRGYGLFHRDGLASFDAVFFYTTGELPMSEDQRTALLEFVREGGTFVGSHCASDTFYEWPAYGDMLGGYFDGHPWHEEVRWKIEDPQHPSMRLLEPDFPFTDEIYQFSAPYDRGRQHVLMTLDVSSVPMDRESIHRDDQDFALTWERAEGKGGVFYTALGHRPEVWRSAWFRDLLVEGTLAVCDAPPAESEPEPAAQPSPSLFRQSFTPEISLEFAPIPQSDGTTLWISTTEIPWELYDLFFLRDDEQVAVDGITGPSRSVFPVTRGFGHDGIPALGMTLSAAQEFCRWASQTTGRTMRLPTESEWRVAAGAAPSAADLGDFAWFADNASAKPHLVASLQPNAFGLYDMFGNVGEWVVGDHPKGVLLGGNFLSSAADTGPDARSTYSISWQDRDPQWPKSSWWMSDGGFAGFRVVTLEGPNEDPEPTVQSETQE